jgi:hypothetical protein
MTARRHAVRALKRATGAAMEGLPMPVIEPGAHWAAAPFASSVMAPTAATAMVRILIMGVSFIAVLDLKRALNLASRAE